ncbi:MAG: hypothetical protein ACLGI5_17130 [Thermoleophilia bacterium]
MLDRLEQAWPCSPPGVQRPRLLEHLEAAQIGGLALEAGGDVRRPS